MSIIAERYHDISCGHRVTGHEGKCRHLHGHNYRIFFTIQSDTSLDDLGRVLDFSVIKSLLCSWLEEEWDHKFLAWEDDPVMHELYLLGVKQGAPEVCDSVCQSIVWVPFNPTAENMADFLLRSLGPARLTSTGCRLIKVTVEETRKCSATASL